MWQADSATFQGATIASSRRPGGSGLDAWKANPPSFATEAVDCGGVARESYSGALNGAQNCAVHESVGPKSGQLLGDGNGCSGGPSSQSEGQRQANIGVFTTEGVSSQGGAGDSYSGGVKVTQNCADGTSPGAVCHEFGHIGGAAAIDLEEGWPRVNGGTAEGIHGGAVGGLTGTGAASLCNAGLQSGATLLPVASTQAGLSLSSNRESSFSAWGRPLGTWRSGVGNKDYLNSFPSINGEASAIEEEQSKRNKAVQQGSSNRGGRLPFPAANNISGC